MNKIWLVLKREYLVRVQKKSFIIMTLLGPLLMLLIMFLPIYLANQAQTQRIIGISQENHNLYSKLKNTEHLIFSLIPDVEFEKIKTNELESNYYALLDKDTNTYLLYSNQQISLSVSDEISNQIEKNMEYEKLEKAGIDFKIIENAKTNISIINKVISKDGISRKSRTEISMGIGFISGILIYIFIFMYGTMVMRSVIEEKTNRIIEIIISSIKPFNLMMGKIIGVSLIGLTQFVLWIVLTIILSITIQGYLIDIDTLSTENNLQHQSMLLSDILSFASTVNITQIILSFIFFFIGGYLMYGSMFAAVGSAVDAEADSQQFILPVTIPLIISFVLIQPIMDNPDGSLAFWMSMIPLTSPIVMMVRLPFGVENWQLLLSMGILVISFIISTLIAAKIYRTGILMYGKKITYKELWKWLKYK